jgi:predicted nucleic acid-binding protein
MRGTKTSSFFLDANVLLYVFDHDATEKRAIAKELVEAALSGGGLVSYQVVQETLNVLSSSKWRVPVPEIQNFLNKVLMRLCLVYPTTGLFEGALGISAETGWTFHDGLIVAAASKAGCSILYTEDLQDGRVIRDVTIQNPFK